MAAASGLPAAASFSSSGRTSCLCSVSGPIEQRPSLGVSLTVSEGSGALAFSKATGAVPAWAVAASEGRGSEGRWPICRACQAQSDYRTAIAL